jgi:hypothetical protein
MNEIPDEIRARLKRLRQAERCRWFWDEEEDQWALPLSDLDGKTIDVIGYVALLPDHVGRWHLRFVIGDEWGRDFDPRNLIFARLPEAKRYVDMLIGLDSGDIPDFDW